jgi:hypothetical protein
MKIKAAGWFEDTMKLDEAGSHHREIGHHRRMFQEAVERFHQLDYSDVPAGVDELMICVGSVGPAPSIGESMELRLAYLPARLAEENIVICVRVKRRIEVDKINACVGKFFPIRKPF